MTMSAMGREMSVEELTLQMAYDAVEADDNAARRQGVPTPSEVQAVPSAHRISRQDPDWYKKLARQGGMA